jgi:hypothetical protein
MTKPLGEQAPIDGAWSGRAQDSHPEAAHRQQRQWHAHADARKRDRRLSDRDQPGDPVGPGGRIPQREHSTQRVADDRRLLEPERVEDVVDQLARFLTDVATSITGGVRQPVTGKVHGEQSAAESARERFEQGRPRGGAEGHAVEQHQWPAAPV